MTRPHFPQNIIIPSEPSTGSCLGFIGSRLGMIHKSSYGSKLHGCLIGEVPSTSR